MASPLSVYLVEPPVKGLAVTAMIARLKKARLTVGRSLPVCTNMNKPAMTNTNSDAMKKRLRA
jgi:hypothetical protein